jgi:AraC-like DNA-binding protein
MPPKHYCKVIQLSSVFRLNEKSKSDQLLDIALACGFYDQSHFITTFKQSIGLSPTKFLNREHAFLQSCLGMKIQMKLNHLTVNFFTIPFLSAAGTSAIST